MNYHRPVMLAECLDGLHIRPEGIYVDVTFGGGGHSGAILGKLGPRGKLVAFDQDPDAEANTINDSRFLLIKDNFRHMQTHLSEIGLVPVNGILADLGVSSHQFDVPERGFSFRFDGNLDMRMNPGSGVTARHVVNTYAEKDLVRIFSEYGEVPNARTLAAALVKARTAGPVEGTAGLLACIGHLVPSKDRSQYLARVFQALRIEVNNELGVLREFLAQCAAVLVSGGRLVVISYHSLEDRLVKNFIQKGNFEGEERKDLYGNSIGKVFRQVHRKPQVPDAAELSENPRSRSAKLRIAEKIS